MKKIVLYIQKNKKAYLLYPDDKTLTSMEEPELFSDNGVLMNLNDIKEKWEIAKVTKTNNKLVLEFKLLIRKTSVK